MKKQFFKRFGAMTMAAVLGLSLAAPVLATEVGETSLTKI